MTQETKYFLLRVEKIANETDMAIAVKNTQGKLVWFPKSQISYNVNTKGKNEVTIRLPQWLAEKNGFLEYEEE